MARVCLHSLFCTETRNPRARTQNLGQTEPVVSEAPTALHKATTVHSSPFEGRPMLVKRAQEEAAKSEALTA